MTPFLLAALLWVMGQACATAATLTSIAVTPTNPTITVGQSQPFTATGTFSDGATRALTSGIGTWDTRMPIPTASYGLGAAFVGGKFYAISGFATPQVAVYDPTEGRWRNGAPLPADTGYNLRQYFGTAVLDGKIYVVGGDTGGTGDRDTLLRYDPAQSSWTTLAPMPGGARYGLGAAAINGLVYAVGGQNAATSTYLSRLEVYNPVTNAWATKASLPTPLSGALVGAINGKLLVAGGSNAGGAQTALYVYNPNTDIWTSGAPMPSPFAGNGDGVVLGGKLFSIGARPQPYERVFAYDEATNSWSTRFAPMPTNRWVMGVAADEANNKIYVVSGYSPSGLASALEIFTPPEVIWASSNTSVATIDATGIASGLGAGTSTITAAAGGISGTSVLSVPACTYSLSTASQSVTGSATTGTLSVTAVSGCAWTATSNVSWLTITSGSSGDGNGTVGYAVAANSTTSSRLGNLTVAGQTVTVTQAALVTAPVAPTAVWATPGDGQATIHFTAPWNDGGSPITSYTVTSTPAGGPSTDSWFGGTNTSINMTRLNNGTAYTFTVKATNSAGTSAPSAPSASVTPMAPAVTVNTAPVPPTGVWAMPGNGQATVYFAAPWNNGGSPITGYTVTSNPGGIGGTLNGATPAPITVSGLVNGTAYTFTVTATNNVGTSSASAPSVSVIPLASAETGPRAPVPPGAVWASPGNGSATVHFSAPWNNGGSPITSYTVTAIPAVGPSTDSWFAGTNTSLNLTGLNNGTAYTFTVKATNSANRTSAPSEPSLSVTPVGPTGANTALVPPSNVWATPGDGQATVHFTAPLSNSGSPITSYTVTSIPGNVSVTLNSAIPVPVTVSGLNNGTAYAFTVKASNGTGTSSPSAPSASVIPVAAITAPVAPTGVWVMPGNGQVTVHFAAPWSNGGSPITSYTVTSTPGNVSATLTGATPAPVMVFPLANYTAYTFTVTATNSVGTSPASAPSTSVTLVPPTVGPVPMAPGAPSGVWATPGNGQATVNFTVPGNNGGSAITNYTVTSNPAGAVVTTLVSPTTVTGLQNNTAYTFTVTATNSAGTSSPSAPSASVTPVAPVGTAITPPVPPSGVWAMPGNGQATVYFSAPWNNGGSPITSYTVTSNPGNVSVTLMGATPAPVTVTGLHNDVGYIFAVTATNSVGTSSPSETSVSVTPTASAATADSAPVPPSGVWAMPGNGQATVYFVAPWSDGGSPITSYTVTSNPGNVSVTLTGASAAPVIVSGLNNDTAYTFTVTATNSANRTSAPSARSSSVTPVASAGTANTAPVPPSGVWAMPGNGQATVYFVAPWSDGGSPITSYTVTSDPGNVSVTLNGATPAPVIVSGLSNGTAYTFTVTATNSANRTSAPSAPSPSVTLAP